MCFSWPTAWAKHRLRWGGQKLQQEQKVWWRRAKFAMHVIPKSPVPPCYNLSSPLFRRNQTQVLLLFELDHRVLSKPTHNLLYDLWSHAARRTQMTGLYLLCECKDFSPYLVRNNNVKWLNNERTFGNIPSKLDFRLVWYKIEGKIIIITPDLIKK